MTNQNSFLKYLDKQLWNAGGRRVFVDVFPLRLGVPESETAEDDTRVFVKQLSHIGINKNRIRKAQENHDRAFAQRAKWLRTELLHISELEDFETKLEMEWSEFFEMMPDDLEESATAAKFKKAARDLTNGLKRRHLTSNRYLTGRTLAPPI